MPDPHCHCHLPMCRNGRAGAGRGWAGRKSFSMELSVGKVLPVWGRQGAQSPDSAWGYSRDSLSPCFSSWSRAKGTSLLCPWGLPNPGLQEHPSHQELQVQLSPQVSSPVQLRGAQLPCQPMLALSSLLCTCHPHQQPAFPCTHPPLGSAPCLGAALALPRPGPKATWSLWLA